MKMIQENINLTFGNTNGISQKCIDFCSETVIAVINNDIIYLILSIIIGFNILLFTFAYKLQEVRYFIYILILDVVVAITLIWF